MSDAVALLDRQAGDGRTGMETFMDWAAIHGYPLDNPQGDPCPRHRRP